jgi:ketosteroid isomerase-like protein
MPAIVVRMEDPARWVRDTWNAMSGGDLAPLEAALAPDARWRAVHDGPWNCESRQQIVEVMGRNLATGLSGQVEEVLEVGDRLVVAFRPDHHHGDGWPLDNGVRYLVVTMDGDQVTELKGCESRSVALEYAEAS